ncbi:YceI family protein [Azohydromonas lata]|uniref:YceI family protein n=1 Tax=Azohydromonas lata TaxID=45677 RepID=A0ABU5IEZ0_9BURK|nr:YceI family protein [Azohydromonas lata]MDZ5457101.1 YceI family protein [Azohydromonas lata]
MKPSPAPHRLLPALLAWVLTACGPHPGGPQPPPAAPAGQSVPPPATLRAEPGTYTLDPARSEIAVLVRRGGALARLGHDHVVSHPALQGHFSVPAGGGSRAEGEVTVLLSGLVVDDPALRARYALDTQPTPAAVEGTRANMLQRVLQDYRFPLARLRLSAEPRPSADVDVEIALHGVTRRQRVAVDWQAERGELRGRGRLVLLQSDFGMQPLTVLGGALRVEDRLEMDFELRARRDPDGAAPRPPA